MNWLILTLISVFGVSIAGVLQRAIMKDDKSDPYAYAVIFQFLIAILILPVTFLHGFKIPEFNENSLVFILAAFLWGGASIFNFKALKLIEASEVTILSSVRVIITILASIFFLQESFSGLNIIGTILILVSVALVSNLKKGIKFNKGVIYTFIMALFAGLAIVADGYNLRNYDVISYNTLTNFLVVTILLVFNPRTVKQVKKIIKPDFIKKMTLLGVFATIQGLAYMFALANDGNASRVGTIRQAAVIVTVLLAIIFLKEKDHMLRKLSAAAMVTVGVILLS
jgi:drug/metabolite transporter (DMT)-like permease